MSTSYDLEKAAKEVVHDYAWLVVAGNDTQKPLPNPFNHYAERTFLIHCRAFAKFFGDGTDNREMYARDFVDQLNSTTLTEWGNWHTHMNQHLAHLTKARVSNVKEWTGADDKKILDGFVATWRDFYSKLKPSVKPAFDTQIAVRQQEFPNVPLT